FKQGKSWWVEDPLNPNRARDPFGANSVAHGEGYEIPTWTQPDPEARFGGVDVLLNNAGYGAYGALEATPMDVIRRQFDVNLFGLIATTKAVLPGMRARKSGVIVNVSSVGGRMCYPFGALYHGSKWAVEGLSEALHFELIRWGSG
ncbi:MAG: SDR family NAD(P)-dependent oxidoreductase, partial [Sandaracinaceae bacterium]